MEKDVRSNTRYPVARQFRRWESKRRSKSARLEDRLLRSVDAGLVAVIFLVPLIMGGRTALGQLALVVLALWIAVCWCLRQCLAPRAAWVRSSGAPLLLVALILVGVQLAPLPPSVLNRLSPQVYETLPVWAPNSDSSSTIGVWTTLSLTPARSRDGLVLLLAFSLLFVVTVQRVGRVEDAERLIRWIAISTIAMAVFALIHYFATNGEYFWFFEHPYARPDVRPAGSFTNRNHFAHFIALGIGPLIWWIQDAIPSSLRRGRARSGRFGQNEDAANIKVGLRAIGLAVVVFAGLLSLSRGGAMAMSTAALVSALILYRGSLIGHKSLLIVLTIVLFVGVSLSIYGYHLVGERLDDFGSIAELDKGQARRKLWQADIAGIADYPLLGTGLASHRDVCPMYLQNCGRYERLEFTHAESGYVQIGLETGVIGLTLVFLAMALCTHWWFACIRRRVPTQVLLCIAAIAPALAASFVHSLVDFVWYVPGCMVAVVVLAACACRLSQLTRDHKNESADVSWMPRGMWLTMAGCLVVIGCFLVQNRLAAVRAEPYWHRYLRLSRSAAQTDDPDRLQMPQSMVDALYHVLEYQPDHARAHSRLASLHIQLFNHPHDSAVRPLDVTQVREAVLASRFESAEAMEEWLSRAFGERRRHLYEAWRHARRAVTLCPLQGEAYLYLAQLSFLSGPNSPAKAAYTSQALKVRPFDGRVLLAAGQEAALSGDLDKALAFWKASFKAGRVHQYHLLDRLAGQVPSDFILETFQPDPAAIQHLITLYRERNELDALRIAQERYAEACENDARHARGKEAATGWMEVARTYGELGNSAEQLRCLRNAVGCDLSCYHARRALGECLYRMRSYEEAEEHLTWCLRRDPQNKRLRALVETVVEGRLRMTSQLGISTKTSRCVER